MKNRLFLVIALLWTSFTVVSLGVISAMIVLQPAFSLGFGWIRTRGLAGLWITVPSLLLGLSGLILLQRRVGLAARLLLVYSGFWALILLPGMLAELPTIVRHPIAYCASGTCTPWVITFALTISFVLSTILYAHRSYSH